MLLVNCNLITKILLQQILISYNVTFTCRGLISGGDDKCKEMQRWPNTRFRPNVGIGSMFGLVIISFLGSMGEGGGDHETLSK